MPIEVNASSLSDFQPFQDSEIAAILDVIETNAGSMVKSRAIVYLAYVQCLPFGFVAGRQHQQAISPFSTLFNRASLPTLSL